jgi:hypothetical protein
MESTENKKQNTELSKSTTITIKVNNAEKSTLQEMADNVELSLSEFIRLKALSTLNSVTNYEQALDKKESELKKLKIALAFYEGNKMDTPGIALPMTEIQAHELYMIFSKYYDNTTPFENQLIRYLLEDLFTPHYQFEKESILDIGFCVQNTIKPVRVEVPMQNRTYSGLAEAFREYGTFNVNDRVFNQIKAPKNSKLIEAWKQSEE